MQAVAYSTFRNNLKANMRKVHDEAEPLLVVNKDEDDNIVVMSARDYESLMETFRIYSNRPLYDKIVQGIEQLERGEGRARELADD